MTRFIRRLLSARISRFTLIGAFGAVANLILLSGFVDVGVGYVVAGIIANELTIISNFIMQERMVFNGTEHRRPLRVRFLHSFVFNTLEGMARVPVLYVLVEFAHLVIPVAQGAGLVTAFFARYIYHLKLVYAPVTLAAGTADDSARPS